MKVTEKEKPVGVFYSFVSSRIKTISWGTVQILWVIEAQMF